VDRLSGDVGGCERNVVAWRDPRWGEEVDEVEGVGNIQTLYFYR
jgi:hypothetical protein